MDRQEPDVNPRFQKNAVQELFLERLNQILEPHDPQWATAQRERHPVFHVIGPPRSGTTFLMQLIAHHLDVGYVNHLIAAFWKAPIQGILLSRKLLQLDGQSDFRSEFGRTTAITEPHEFGYFWSAHLRYQDMAQKGATHAHSIDWFRLRDVLSAMTRAFERPAVFKPFLLIWHLCDMQRVAPDTSFIRIRRQPADNALSLLQARRVFLRDERQWLSLRPHGCRHVGHLAPWEQVVHQVCQLETWLDEQVAGLQRGSVLELDYEQVCAEPIETVARVRQFMAERGADVVLRRPVDPACARPAAAARDSLEWRRMATLLSQLNGMHTTDDGHNAAA